MFVICRIMCLTFMFCLISLSMFFEPVISADTVTPSTSLVDGRTLTSSGGIFELGFFSPGSISKNLYLGIWYRNTPNVIVWVANRTNPITNPPGEFVFIGNRSLALFDKTRSVVWSVNFVRAVKNPAVRLMNTGNFVLIEDDGVGLEKNYLWQSFDYPTDTLLVGMKHGRVGTGPERALTSWRNVDDPATGNFTYRFNTDGPPQLVLSMGSTRKFPTGIWNGVRFSGLDIIPDTIFRSVFEFTGNDSYYMFTLIDESLITRLTLDISGSPQRLIARSNSTEWDIMYSLPYQRCDIYGLCGQNSVCVTNNSPVCRCIEGFIPKSWEEWKVLNWRSGCIREILLDCRKGEGFSKLVGVKLPDLLEFEFNESTNLEECNDECFKNCSCTAYANSDVRKSGSGCLKWFGDLVDIKEVKVKGSDQVLYVRLSASEIKSMHDKNIRKRLIITLVVFTIISFGLVLCCVNWRLRKRVKAQNEIEGIEFSIFELATIAASTNNFSSASEIGKGGFGLAYKGTLGTRQEIAVKRMSKNSGQGLEEFKNEVYLISKLQHRNLVALLGCCVEGEERMLIYEYICNKSLDHFIFNQSERASLNWDKLFDIITGIARGLLYLHQDSKLQIIHRDLKASNVLLDASMNPKISDFGLARAFKGGEDETETKRVVGTYGYLSPEYAVDGKFSVKSDVFSFGVVLLEILSGKRSTGFFHPDNHDNLLEHVWYLWIEDKAMELLSNGIFKGTRTESQVQRCVHVGLLCVQKMAVDRPTMASVVVMLVNERAELPWPKEPAFLTEINHAVAKQMPRAEESETRNQMSSSSLDGR